MISKQDLRNWIDSLEDDTIIAIDDDGISLCEIYTCNNEFTGAYLEVGGVPTDEENDHSDNLIAVPLLTGKLEIKVGGVYKNSFGDVVRIIKEHTDGPSFSFGFPFLGDDDRSYMPNGRYDETDAMDPLRLVCEYEKIVTESRSKIVKTKYNSELDGQICDLLVMSARHLNQNTYYRWLDEKHIFSVKDPKVGAFVAVDKERTDQTPEDLERCLKKAETLGCDWVFFDIDYEPEEDLPHYAW